MMRSIFLYTLLGFFALIYNAGANELHKAQIIENYGKIPLSFVDNQGQVDSRVKFTTTGSGATMFFTTEGTTFLLKRSGKEFVAEKQKHALKNIGKNLFRTNPLEILSKQVSDFGPEYYAFKLRFMDANPHPEVVGEDMLSWNSNYFIGNDPNKWRTDVPNYRKMRLKNLYKGVDLVYYGNQNNIKYDFVVQPGTDPGQILLAYDFGNMQKEQGAISINDDGELVVRTPLGDLIERKPYAYQIINRKEVELEIHYKIVNRKLNHFTFSLYEYNSDYPVIIDPELSYSTFLGGSGNDWPSSQIAIDGGGNLYITGYTQSSDFPTTSGAYDESHGGGNDVFVSKLNSTGDALVYSTFIGGSSTDEGRVIAIDGSDNLYITGYTQSSDFPTTTGAYNEIYNGGTSDGFMSKMNSMGNTLLYSTYLGGSGVDEVYGMAIDNSSNAYITGGTRSSDFPTTSGAYDESFNGGSHDGFVIKLNSMGSAPVYSTFLGGNGADYGMRMVVDGSGTTYITGSTASSDFPITLGAYDESFNGGTADAFLCKLNSAGSSLVYSTFLGGSGYEYGNGIVVDASGYVYVTGFTNSSGFPTTPGAYDESYNGGVYDAIISKLNSTGTALVYSTFLGGSGYDVGTGIAIDGSGNAYITGETQSSDFPTTTGAYDESLGGARDAFMTELNSAGSALDYSTFLGGSGTDYSLGIAIDGSNNAYITGMTESSDFITTPGAYDISHNGGEDVYVSKFSFGTTNTAPTASFTVSPSSGTTSTTFSVDASGSSDAQDAVTSLQVRWDWNNDGTYDTDYSTTKTATHQYSAPGEYWIMLEVMDRGGLTDTTMKRIVVAYGVVNDGYGDYVLVPAGSFQMGDNFNEGPPAEKPVHTVFIDSFYVGKYEVTNGEYKKFLDDGGYANSSYWTEGGFGQYGSYPYYWNNSTYRGGGISGNENFPVLGISWYEAMAYCKWLSAKTGKTYRLATEAEWEKAARGTDQRRYSWGNNIDNSYTNDYRSGDPFENSEGFGLTPVGFYDGNINNSFVTHNNTSPYGAFDMMGNLWEWCLDWFSSTYYSSSPTINPQGPSSGSTRIIRGCSWGDPIKDSHLRASYRNDCSPDSKNDRIGFRCAREIYVNTPPTASFTVSPTSGTTSTTFCVDASVSSDAQDPVSALQVRWDWESDGTCDTEYSMTKTTTHQYSSPGEYWVMLEVKDTGGLTGTITQTVKVLDTTPPELKVTLSPDNLWPPNHKMVNITASIEVKDNSDPSPVVQLVSISINESDNGKGDGNTLNDIKNADFGTNDRNFLLRAERSGEGNGRTYSIIYSATDLSGNTSYDTAYVSVGHDKGNGRLGKMADFDTPDSYELAQNYPNPFNPETQIRYSITNSSFVRLEIYNISGQLVRMLVSEHKPLGNYSVVWDGRDDAGHVVASGIYLYRLKAENFSSVKKMLYLK